MECYTPYNKLGIRLNTFMLFTGTGEKFTSGNPGCYPVTGSFIRYVAYNTWLTVVFYLNKLVFTGWVIGRNGESQTRNSPEAIWD
ncbi:hypothetical protein ACFLYV_00965 [Chloroflexota bacterium]